MKKITWTNDKRRLSDLVPWEKNPRQINQTEAQRLAESFDAFGQVETIAIGPDNQIYNGHQRLRVLMQKYGGAYEVEVRVASRPLTEDERKKLTVFLHKGTLGEWDFDILANNFEVADLLDWGFRPYELGLVGDGNKIDELWRGMPEFENEDRPPYHTIKVHFEAADDMLAFARLIGQDITIKTKYIYYPKQQRADLKKMRVIDDES